MQTHKSAGTHLTKSRPEKGLIPDQMSNDTPDADEEDIDFNQLRTKNQSVILSQPRTSNQKTQSTAKKLGDEEDEDEEPMTPLDEAKILQQAMDSNSDDEDTEAQVLKVAQKSNGSIVSEDDFFNRSLQSDQEDQHLDATNYLRYAGGKDTHKYHLLEIVDRNERAYKSNAEKMVNAGSQLVTTNEAQDQTQQRRLTH